jgi:hypothetical protein
MRPLEIEVYDQTGTNPIYKKIQAYLITSYELSEGQNINIKYSPYTTTGKTQNLGRKPMELLVNIRLTKKFSDLYDIFKYKRDRNVVKITLHGDNLPSDDLLKSGKFYISEPRAVIEAPTYIDVTLPLIEFLDVNIRRTNVNLVQGAFAEDFKTLLKQFYGVGVGQK